MSEDRDKPATPEEEDGSFLARWSRRKQAAREGRLEREPAEPQRARREEAAEAAPAVGKRPTEEPPIDLAKLPKIEDLTASSDFSVFLRKGVPEELQRLALRKAWTLDPAIRDFIEVADYQWDFNVPGGAPCYGPLDAGTNIEALLAQATGQGFAAPKPPVEEGVAALEPKARSAMPLSPDGGQTVDTEIGAAERSDPGEQVSRADHRGLAAAPGPADATDADATNNAPATAEAVAAAESREPARGDAEAPRAKRRHGGALPA